MNRQIYDFERRIYGSWRKRLGNPPSQKYELDALRSYRNTHASLVSEREAFKKARACAVICVGDDRLISEDSEKLMEVLRRVVKKPKEWVFLSDRSLAIKKDEFGKPLLWLQKRKIKRVSLPFTRNLYLADQRMINAASRFSKKGKKVFIWTGSLRVAPCHLPMRAEKSLLPVQFVSFHCDPMRWKLHRHAGWAKLADNVFGWLGCSPLQSLEARRIWSEGKGDPQRVSEIIPTFYSAAKSIGQKIQESKKQGSVQVIHPYDLNSLQRLLRLKDSNLKRFLVIRLQRGESALGLDSRRRIHVALLTSLEVGHIAEEAAHWVRWKKAMKGSKNPYGIGVEEAFAFMASRWFDPNREVPVPSNRLDPWSTVHLAGYHLGKFLSGRWKVKRARTKIRTLWHRHPHDEREARALWNELRRVV